MKRQSRTNFRSGLLSADFLPLLGLALMVATLTTSNSSLAMSSDPVCLTYLTESSAGSDEALLAALAVPGYVESPYNTNAMTFWTSNLGPADSLQPWINPSSHFSLATRENITGVSAPTTSQFQLAIKALDQTAGHKRLVGVFGATDSPIANGHDAATLANQLAIFVIQNHFDGVVIDWQEASYFLSGTGAGETWLGDFTATLRSLLPSPSFTIAHAPQASYFAGAPFFTAGGYLDIHDEVGAQIDWYAIQFYNQGSTTYDDYTTLFETANGWAANTAIGEMVNGSNSFSTPIPVEKIVVGKFATPADGMSGYISPSELAGILESSSYPTRGVAIWRYSSDRNVSFAMGARLCDDTVWYVDSDATPSGDGTSWASAFSKVQDALAMATTGQEIWIAEGVYYPDDGAGQTNDDPTSSFNVPLGVHLYGGFVGDETSSTDNDPENHPTILSGDIDGDDDDPDGDNIANTWSDSRGINALHVVSIQTGHTARLDGLTITAGKANSAPDDETGAAIRCLGGASPRLHEITMSGNYVSNRFNYNDCSGTVTSSKFLYNYAGDLGAVSGSGGTYDDSLFQGNRAGIQAAAFYWNDKTAVVTNSIFQDNLSSQGAGLFLQSGGSTYFENVLFLGNTGPSIIQYNQTAISTLVNTTFTGNYAWSHPTIRVLDSLSSIKVRNSILWQNKTTDSDPGLPIDAPELTVDVEYSVLQASGGSNAWTATNLIDSGNNLDEDPGFIKTPDLSSGQTSNAIVHLKSGSISVDAGSQIPPNLLAVDLDGEARIQDTAIDLGVYEGAALAGDASVTVTDQVDQAVSGESHEYDVSVLYTGPSSTGLKVIAPEASGLSCDWQATPSGTVTGLPPNGQGTFEHILNVDSGATIDYHFVCDISPNRTSDIQMTASVETLGADVFDSNVANNSDSAVLTLTQVVDASVSISDGVSIASPSDELIYSIVVSNSGPSVARALLSVSIPEALGTCQLLCPDRGSACGQVSGQGTVIGQPFLEPGDQDNYQMTCTAPVVFGYSSIETSVAVSPRVSCRDSSRGCRAAWTDTNPEDNSATDIDLPPLFASGVEGGDGSEWSKTVGG